MTKFMKPSKQAAPSDIKAFVKGAEERSNVLPRNAAKKNSAPKIPFVLKLEHEDHELLRTLSEKEDRSMQWMLRKIASEAIRKRYDEEK